MGMNVAATLADTQPAPPTANLHQCSCGSTYTQAEWDAFPSIGFMDGGFGRLLDLRNCACGSTMSREVDADAINVMFRALAKRVDLAETGAKLAKAIERAACIEVCEVTALRLNAEGDEAGGFGAIVARDELRKRVGT